MLLSDFSFVIRSVSVDGIALMLFSGMTTGNESFGRTICGDVLLKNTDIDERNSSVARDSDDAEAEA
jgi:hypothetical protein